MHVGGAKMLQIPKETSWFRSPEMPSPGLSPLNSEVGLIEEKGPDHDHILMSTRGRHFLTAL